MPETRALQTSFQHGSPSRVGILYCNLGTPDEPKPAAVRRYLREFLSDPRVVEIPRLVWLPILHGIILRTRPKKSAHKYASIWLDRGSPLAVWTQAQASALQVAFEAERPDVVVCHAMRYGQPNVATQLDALVQAGATRILILPAYPQYSGTTTASVLDAVQAWSRTRRAIPEFRFVNRYHDHPAYIGALARQVRRHWAAHGRGQQLLMSFHGVPERTLLLGDPYHCECHKTARLLAEALELPAGRWKISFQSRFGKAKWIEPATDTVVGQLAREGVRELDVLCPGFPCDCLETLEEIAIEARELFVRLGGTRFSYIPCLNDSVDAVQMLQTIAQAHLGGWSSRESPAELDASRRRALEMGARN